MLCGGMVVCADVSDAAEVPGFEGMTRAAIEGEVARLFSAIDINADGSCDW